MVCRLDCSQRRACEVTGFSRSTQRYVSVRGDRDRALTAAIYQVVATHPRYGYRMVTAKLQAAGWCVNAKRVYRLWRREGLKVPRKMAKNKAKGNSENSCYKRPSQHKDDVWAMDFIHDSTASGQPLKLLVVMDEYTRECLALEVGGGRFSGDRVADVLTELFTIRGVPRGIRSDNGKEFVGRVVSGRLQAAGVQALQVEAGCPWENGVVESLNSILRDELLNTELFATVKAAREMATAWQLQYNHRRPHGALGYVCPAEYATCCQAATGSAALRPTQPGSKKDKTLALS